VTGDLLENRVYNKPNGCSATGALAPGPDHQQQPTCRYKYLKHKTIRFLRHSLNIEHSRNNNIEKLEGIKIFKRGIEI
jgi:hypothetical protein